ncbi:MAG TPA: hypothetical protein VKP03_01120 [Patescibacteria group bacterium]|nr:hypothetical protein [Patescibacteria group bacterium]
MKVFKEYVEQPEQCLLRGPVRNDSLDFFWRLYLLARQDFPKLNPKEVQVINKKPIFGIVFRKKPEAVPSSYERLFSFEEVRQRWR